MGHCFQHFQEAKIKSKPAFASTTEHRSVVILTGQTRENKKTPYFVGNTKPRLLECKEGSAPVGTGDGNVNCGDDNGEGRGNSERGGEWSGVEWGDKETAIWNSRTL